MNQKRALISSIIQIMCLASFLVIAPLSVEAQIVKDISEEKSDEIISDNTLFEPEIDNKDTQKDTSSKKKKKTTKSKKKKSKKKKTKKAKASVQFFTEMQMEYSDNIYGLSDSQKSKLRANEVENQVSGRYSGMDSITDYVIAPTLKAKFKLKNTPVGKINVTSSIKYNLYKENSKANFTEGQIKIKRKIDKKNGLEFKGEFALGKFKKNYLSGVNDLNSNGNIPREERVYSAADYDQFEGTLSYDHVLIKDKEKQLSSLKIVPFLGCRWRNYNSDFNNRDYNLPFGGLELDFGFGPRFDFKVKYQYGKLDSESGKELFLYDETILKADVNGDGKIKGNAPISSVVDRACNRKTIEFETSYKLSKETTFYAEYSNRKEYYTTSNAIDIDRYGQDGYKKKFKSGFKFDIAQDLSAEIGYQKTNNRDSDDDEYTEKTYLVSLQFALN